MPFIRQVKQNGKPGGAGLGRVFPVDTIANQFHGLENRYMIGSGVGAVSSSNRRALMRRAYRYVPTRRLLFPGQILCMRQVV